MLGIPAYRLLLGCSLVFSCCEARTSYIGRQVTANRNEVNCTLSKEPPHSAFGWDPIFTLKTCSPNHLEIGVSIWNTANVGWLNIAYQQRREGPNTNDSLKPIYKSLKLSRDAFFMESRDPIRLFDLLPNTVYSICYEMIAQNEVTGCLTAKTASAAFVQERIRGFSLEKNFFPRIVLAWNPLSPEGSYEYHVCLSYPGQNTGNGSTLPTSGSCLLNLTGSQPRTEFITTAAQSLYEATVIVNDAQPSFGNTINLNLTYQDIRTVSLHVSDDVLSLNFETEQSSDYEHEVDYICSSDGFCSNEEDQPCIPTETVNGTTSQNDIKDLRASHITALISHYSNNIKYSVGRSNTISIPTGVEDMKVDFIPEDRAIQFIWKRGRFPWSPTSLQVTCGANTISKGHLTGCEIHAIIENLEPFTDYNCTIVINMPQLVAPVSRAIEARTRPGICSKIEDLSIVSKSFGFENTIQPELNWRLSKIKTGNIDKFVVSVADTAVNQPQTTLETLNCFDTQCRSYCKEDGQCSTKLNKISFFPGKTYKVSIACYNAQSTDFSDPHDIEITTEDAIPDKSFGALQVKKSIDKSDHPHNQMEIVINKANIDRGAGQIITLEAIYALKGFLPEPQRQKSTTRGARYAEASNGTVLEIGLNSNSFILRRLLPETEYGLKLRTYTSVGFGESDIINFRTAEYPLSYEVYCPLMLLLLLVLLLMIFLINQHQRYDKRILDVDNSVMLGSGFPIAISEVEKKVTELLSGRDLEKQFDELKRTSPKRLSDVSQIPENFMKNRYTDIVPFDFSRVVLKEVAGIAQSDYINASYLHGYKTMYKFIAAQGPLHDTCSDFWRMIWEKDVKVIVMLTKCIENRKEKCEMYCPQKGGILILKEDTYEKVFIETLEEENRKMEGFFIRKLKITTTTRFLSVERSYSKEVTQYHFTAWPDMQCPNRPSQLLNFIFVLRDATASDVSHIVVNCSAGVGRTGTYILLDSLIDEIYDDKRKEVDIFTHVIKMRHFRLNMVQTLAQYVFIHKCLILICLCKDEAKDLANLEKMESELSYLRASKRASSVSIGSLSRTKSFPEDEDLIPISDSEPEPKTNTDADKNQNPDLKLGQNPPGPDKKAQPSAAIEEQKPT